MDRTMDTDAGWGGGGHHVIGCEKLVHDIDVC